MGFTMDARIAGLQYTWTDLIWRRARDFVLQEVWTLNERCLKKHRLLGRSNSKTYSEQHQVGVEKCLKFGKQQEPAKIQYMKFVGFGRI
ncbi:hypothetical protein QZH41_013037 [Actinostola sp. cb2023]|nr:hypothetical protein QZH41_013037 [Actinostola sp. cb2023]